MYKVLNEVLILHGMITASGTLIIYKELINQNVDVLLDDLEENMSNKFKKHDLIGTPYQIIIGSKSEENKFEFKEVNSESENLSLEAIKAKLRK